ncbi:tRNA lysidine(34) synthetase TilS [Kibdelosporangium phytohabitans]|uniref:tRNA(Ile)-lysidine synthase n=1 Tax=Kibdelosporangium phytohabitans TaxID=860235 RepID=A0A0N9HV16_9PSEU|nr:tRNA lysidine(34) synthetase TilS [Kibdelosporangium phytohabitans]ALG05882.1 tRNA(Ile)-lysidine synthetase [Kibdelosporangium phytohabitans]MBE1466076.1 tRNA(Ile)-lysidine synthase [Kibdelosporangium phytohabitans]
MAAPSATLIIRKAVKDLLNTTPQGPVAVAVSGGADSLALAAATATLTDVTGLIVDHGLQHGSAGVAEEAAAQLKTIGVDARVLRVEVTGPGGLEAAARRVRYQALRSAHDGVILLGHTMDDQAETVLLGLGRGSGPRSIAGMRPYDPPWGRPLLKVRRAVTVAACAELGLQPWADPHNSDPSFTRVRLRHDVIPLMEEVLQGGVAGALARTAEQLREDLDALDAMAAMIRHDTGNVLVTDLEPHPPALRRRALRTWLKDAGVPELTDGHLRSVDALVGEWRGQGGVWLPGGFVVCRRHGRLCVQPPAGKSS